MTMPSRAVITQPGEGRTIGVFGDVYRFLATGEDTNGKYALWEAVVPPGGGPPPHAHSREEEGFYILEGEFTLYVAEPTGITKQVGRPGDFIWGPRDYPHYYHISGAQGARVLGDGNPKVGAHDKPVLFLHPKDFCGTLVELEQA